MEVRSGIVRVGWIVFRSVEIAQKVVFVEGEIGSNWYDGRSELVDELENPILPGLELIYRRLQALVCVDAAERMDLLMHMSYRRGSGCGICGQKCHKLSRDERSVAGRYEDVCTAGMKQSRVYPAEWTSIPIDIFEGFHPEESICRSVVCHQDNPVEDRLQSRGDVGDERATVEPQESFIDAHARTLAAGKYDAGDRAVFHETCPSFRTHTNLVLCCADATWECVRPGAI